MTVTITISIPDAAQVSDKKKCCGPAIAVESGGGPPIDGGGLPACPTGAGVYTLKCSPGNTPCVAWAAD